MDVERSVSCLVVGTENKDILILDPSGTVIMKQVQLPAVPSYISVQGVLDIEYRIVVACRNGSVYTIKKGKVLGGAIELETQVCGLAIMDKSLIIACMDHTIHSYHMKGKKNYTIYLPAPISIMLPMDLKRTRQDFQALVVALANGEVRLYNKRQLVHTMTTNETVTAMRVGPYGREEMCLILCFKSGALSIHILSRTSQLDANATTAGPPPEQDIPLSIPKKTKLYLEQTQRERDQHTEMHRIFQRDLCKLRLNTARSFVKMITDGTGPMSTTRGSAIRLDVQVQGLGPIFKLKLYINNASTKAVVNVPITFAYNPVLVPGVNYDYEVIAECMDDHGAAGVIRAFICANQSSVPILSAIVNMPVSEVLQS